MTIARQIKFKPGVLVLASSLCNYHVVDILIAAVETAPADYVVTVTSGCDGKHLENSSHYRGKAFDFRIRDLSGSQARTWTDRLRLALGNRYFVLLEPDHIHVQFNGD